MFHFHVYIPQAKRICTCKDRKAQIKSNIGYWRMTSIAHQTHEQIIKEFINSLHQLEGALGTVNLELACLRQIEPVPIRGEVLFYLIFEIFSETISNQVKMNHNITYTWCYMFFTFLGSKWYKTFVYGL